MNSFDDLIADFSEKAGLALPSVKDGSVDLVVDGIDVSVQYRPDRDDCVMFTLPLADTEPEPDMMRKALELSANGFGTGGHFLGIKEGMFVLSSVVKLDGLSVEDFAARLLALAEATPRLAERIAYAAVAEEAEKGAVYSDAIRV